MIEKLKAYEIISKAFDENRVSTEIFLKAQESFLNLLKSIKPLDSVSFGNENSLSVGELMEVLADNREFQHYCDAIILNEGKILLVQRSNNDNFAPGKWCLPGGKAEQGEFLRDAVVRELLEETGICADGCHYSTLYRNEDGSFSHYFFCNCCDFENKVVDADEVQQVAWVSLEELDQYDTLLDVGKRIKEIFNVPFEGKVLTEQELEAIAVNKPDPIKRPNILGEFGDIVLERLHSLLKIKKAERGELVGGVWRTINGAKVYIKGGKVVVGAGGELSDKVESGATKPQKKSESKNPKPFSETRNIEELKSDYIRESKKISEYLRKNDSVSASVDTYKKYGYKAIRIFLNDPENYEKNIVDSSGKRISSMDSEIVKETVDEISDFIDKNKIDKDLILNRRVDVESAPIFTKLKVGDVYEDKSFTSSSYLELSKFGSFNIKIQAKAGSRVANLDNENELEFLIDKGSKFKVLEAKEDGITVELL